MGIRKIVKSLGAPAAIGPYSQAVEAGGLLFVSGQLPLDPQTGEMENGSIGMQAKRCLSNIDSIAREAGGSVASAVKVTVFLTDMADFSEVNEAYSAFFPTDPPARSCLAVLALPKGASIEIEAIIAL
jgi:2-iminobutanoate/2-iminopropanoate deaminase